MQPAATQALDELQDVIRDFIAGNERQEELVVRYANEQQLRQKLDISLPEIGEGEEVLSTWAKGYLDHSVRTGSWRYFNQLWSGFSVPGFYGEVITALSNTSMFTYEVAPVATLIEKELIQRLGELVGYDKCDGLFVTGGSNANMIAMMAARFSLQASCRDEGIDGRRLQLFISDQAHYSFAKAANLMGIGVNNVVKVASDAQTRMIPEALTQAISKSRAAGYTPFFVGATAGTTVTGAFDPLEALSEICQSEGLWFHIDGAFGGSALVSDVLRDKLKGSELSDSFTWDQHKMMGIPLICST
ncbi:MAG: pyridoxal-dependent decarboxylase, partial [Myxococcota bacterium]|nr:pyridoxal-dependent decarboxylase [Myxococcota bacterium]